ncbi:hypothetical protein ELD05_07950 [Caldicellulosiruptor changbaiensis]|uniref:Uncharacterized protein n=1 Tax=Caldicellulosiruptor changbaiensis TaxID=1222016 RepID=A0A3T0D670_9FIRM|nr:hypothetical protein [Caldicellulosiruptor changbaiensis]AZT90581.1 hypothetical protein ELD05_07950 [Caldicellulosiruptor changbaiensis]
MKEIKADIKNKIDQVVEYFRTQNEGKAYLALIELIDILMTYYNENKEEVDIETLQGLLKAIENRDIVLIADILEYELKDKF